MILVDTDVLIEIFDKHSTKGEYALKTLERTGEEITIASITLHELLYGLQKYGKTKTPEIERLETIEFTKEDAILSSKLELDAEKQGQKVPRMDTMIAAIAINRKAKLFTFNQKHFQQFKHLTVLKE
jgi:predicted nucleic acid-binding protein